MPNPDIEDHFRELTSRLEGKDLSRMESKARGTALLVLRGEDQTVHRFGIRLEGRRAQMIRDLSKVAPGDAVVVLQASVPDWLSFFQGANAETAAPLRIHGEVELMAALGELLMAQRSPLETRMGGRR